jgi:hypothetical protein
MNQKCETFWALAAAKAACFMTFEFWHLSADRIQAASIHRIGYPGQAFWDDCD